MQSLITTKDNPWNPFTNWDEWFAFDYAHGYNTPGLLARFAVTSDELSDSEEDKAIDEAICEIILEHPNGIYRLVRENENMQTFGL